MQHINLYACIDWYTTPLTLSHPHLQQLLLALLPKRTQPLLIGCRQLSCLILQLLQLAKLWVAEGDSQLLHN